MEGEDRSFLITGISFRPDGTFRSVWSTDENEEEEATVNISANLEEELLPGESARLLEYETRTVLEDEMRKGQEERARPDKDWRSGLTPIQNYNVDLLIAIGKKWGEKK